MTDDSDSARSEQPILLPEAIMTFWTMFYCIVLFVRQLLNFGKLVNCILRQSQFNVTMVTAKMVGRQILSRLSLIHFVCIGVDK